MRVENSEQKVDPKINRPRDTHSEGGVTNASASLRCCIENGSRPPGVGLQEQTSNRPVLLRSNGVVVNDLGKGICTSSEPSRA